ncbi:MAG TPA: MMPL family transporter, partial [Burkholderiaceae bacterium]
MFQLFATHVVRRRLWVLLAVLAATVFFALQIKNLKIVINPNTMLPAHHVNVIGTNTAEALFGSKHVIVIGVSATDGGAIYRADVLQAVQRLGERIKAIKGVKPHTLMSVAADKAKSIRGGADELQVERLFDGDASLAGIAAFKQRLHANPLYFGTLVAKDETVATVSVAIEAGSGGFREIVDQVELAMQAERSASVTLQASGTPVFFAAVERYAQRMAILFPLALLLIGLIHYEAFRTVQGLLLPLVTALFAVIWGLGIMGAARVPMDAFNATTPILILAVAAGHAVQILKRYYEEYERLGMDVPTLSSTRNDKAIVASLTAIAPVMLTAGLVAALGFFSLITFDVATIRTFGIFTGLGILSALLIELTFIPALRSYLPAPRAVPKAQAGEGPRLWDRLADTIADAIIKRRAAIMAVFAGVVLVAGAMLPYVNRENSTKTYFGEQVPVRQHDRFLNAKLAGTNTVYVTFEGMVAGAMKEPANLKLIEDTQRHIEGLRDVGKTLSIVDFVRKMNLAMQGVDALPASAELVSQYLLLYSMSGAPTDFDAYIDYDYRNACLVIWTRNDSSKYAANLVEQLHRYIDPRLPRGVTVQIGGSVPQSSALSEVLVEGKIKNVLQMIAVVFVAGALIFRSLLAGLYLIVPLAITVLVNFGVMAASGIPLNTPNSVSSAMAIGIGADYAIYLLYRIREELARTGDYTLALRQTLRTAGKAVLYVASAIAGGYAVLMLSFGFYVHIWFGILIVLSMAVSAVSALVLIPCLLAARPPAFLRGKSEAAGLRGATTAAVAALAVGLLTLAGAPDARAEEPDAAVLAEKSYQATRLSASLSEATFRLVAANGQERVRKTFGATKLQANGQDNRRMIRFREPSDIRNTSTLVVESAAEDDEIWIYLPGLKKVRRLAAGNTKSSFVGTDLSYGDLVGYRTGEWQHKLLRKEELAGGLAWVVESTPKTPAVAQDSGYSRRVNWIAHGSHVALRTEFYDPNGGLLKTLDNLELKKVEGRDDKWQPVNVRIANHQT